MAEPKLENKMNDLKIKTDLNILLLGETGVGKSTLINAFANYLTYNDLKKAKKENLLVLIPTLFEIGDKHGERHVISTGQGDKNEYLQTGESATQDVKTYVFPIWDGQIKIRLIDCPGMGDKRGIEQDDTNSENILSYIANIHELHAICYLLKPTESRDTTVFKYCINQIFSRLDKSATENIIFCFTHTRGTDYSPGETIRILKKTVEEIGSKPPFAKIPLNRNIFCFDNEPFRYLAAVQSSVEFESEIKKRNKESWEKSAKQCWDLIKYITGDTKNPPLKPHHVKSTNAVNEARRMINQLAQPLADISQLIYHNVSALERHKKNLAEDTGVLEEMKKQLYMPVITLDMVNLTQPVTVCTARKCAEIYQVGGKNTWHYRQRCHDPCYLNNVPKDIIGAAELINCAAMNRTTTCVECFCEYKIHMHVYYLTKTKETQERDENVQKNITTRQQLMQQKEVMMKDIEIRKTELDQEHRQIVEICAIFAHFLQNNAITPFNDAYKEYIEYLIRREESLGNLCDPETVNHLNELLLQYVDIKNRFDDALRTNRAIGRDDLITSKDIRDNIDKLYKLKHNGKKIKQLYDCQKKSRGKEFQNTEYVHKIAFKKDEKKEKEKKEKKEKEKKDKEKDNKDKKDGKDKDKGGENRSRGNTKNETQRTRTTSPPPSYQEAHRNQRPQNYQYRGPHPQYPPHTGPQYPPHTGPQYPPQTGAHYPPPGGPPYHQYPPNPQYPPNNYGQPPQGYPPQGYGPTTEPYKYDYTAPNGPQNETINITVKKVADPGPNQRQGEPQPQPNPYPSHDPNYPRYPPNPSYPYDPNYPNYPPYNHPSSANRPYYPPQSGGHPPYYPQPYDSHHGVNRQQHYGGGQQRQESSSYRGNNRGRGDYRGGSGRGGVQKNKGVKKNKNDKDNEKEKKSKKGKKSSDSDSSDSSS